MSLSNISKDHVNNLLESLHNNNNLIETLKKNHVNYGKLKLISKQINLLKNEALEIIEDTKNQDKLLNLKTKFSLVSGNTYYLYKKYDETIYLSLISPAEWNNKDKFEGTYYFDFDKQFIKIEK